jgi:hypothetical protein
VCNQDTCVYLHWPPSVVIGNSYYTIPLEIVPPKTSDDGATFAKHMDESNQGPTTS